MRAGTEIGLPDMLSADDIAMRLGLGRSRVYKLIAEGGLPYVRIGRRIRIPSAAWAVWLAEQEKRALAAVAEQERRW